MGKKMNSILLSLFLVFAFVLSGCSVATTATTATTATKAAVDATTVNEGTSKATAATAEDTTAANKYAGESLTILMASGDGSNEAVKAAMDKAAEILGITLEYSVVPDDQFLNVINTKGSTGNLDDVIFTSASLSDLPYAEFAELSGDWVSHISDATKSFTLNPDDGTTIMAPFGAESNFGLAYNKAVLEKAGVTLPIKDYAAFLDACKKIKDTGVAPLYISAQENWTPQILLLSSFTTTLLKDDLVTQLSTNKVKPQDVQGIVDIWNNVKAFSTNGYINDDFLSSSHQMGLEAIANGKAGFYAVTDGAYGEIKTAYGDLIQGVGLTMCPMWNDEADAFVMANRSARMLAATKNGSKLDIAKAFIDTCISQEVMTVYYDMSPGASPYVDMGYDLKSSEWNQEMKELATQFPTHGDWCNNLYDGTAVMNKFFGEFDLRVQSMFSGKTAEAAVTDWYTAYSESAKAQRVEGF